MSNPIENRATKRLNRRTIWRGSVIAAPVISASLIFGHMAATPAAYAQTATPSTTTPSTTTPGTTTPSTTTHTPGLAPRGHGGFGGGHGGPGNGGQRGPGAEATLSAISGNTLTLKAADGSTKTVTVDSNTVYRKAGATIALADLKVGDSLHVRYAASTSGTTSTLAAEIDVVLPQAAGTIKTISGNTLTLTTRNNGTATVTVTGSTVYTRLGQTVTQSALATGETIHVEGTKNSDGSITALTVHIDVPSIGGKVSAVSGNTITVTDPRGSTTRTITVTGSTTYLKAGQAASLSDITVGSSIRASGTLSSDGKSLTAEQVVIELPQVRGTVSAVANGTLTITERNTTKTVKTTSTTKVVQDGAPGTTPTTVDLSKVVVGTNVNIEGTQASDGTFTALLIHIHAAKS